MGKVLLHLALLHLVQYSYHKASVHTRNEFRISSFPLALIFECFGMPTSFRRRGALGMRNTYPIRSSGHPTPVGARWPFPLLALTCTPHPVSEIFWWINGHGCQSF